MSDPTTDLICNGCPHYEMADKPELDEYDRETWHMDCNKKPGETCPKEQEWNELADFARQTGRPAMKKLEEMTYAEWMVLYHEFRDYRRVHGPVLMLGAILIVPQKRNRLATILRENGMRFCGGHYTYFGMSEEKNDRGRRGLITIRDDLLQWVLDKRRHEEGGQP